jgi:hypothetical protein
MASQAVGGSMGNQAQRSGGTEAAAFSHHAAEVVRAARQELDVLMRQRAEIMKRIGAVKQTLVGLTSIFDCSALLQDLSGTSIGAGISSHQTGLTNACRMALLQAGTPLRAHQVRDKLRFQGFSLESHRDPVASVTTILRRLGQYGEARPVMLPDGKRAWVWVAGDTADQDKTGLNKRVNYEILENPPVESGSPETRT